MGRIRTIKPEVLDDHKTARLSNEAWRLFVSALVLADDEGRLPGDAEFLRARIFWGVPRGPFDERSTNVLGALAECSRVGLIRVFEVAGERFLEIRNFTKHQRIDRPGPAKFPEPSQGVTLNDEQIRGTFDERSTNVLGGIGREGKGMEGRGMQGGDAPPAATPRQTADAGDPEAGELDAEFARVLGENLRAEAEKIRAEFAPVVAAEENPPGKKTPRRKPARPLPADWAPNDDHRAIAAERRIDVSAEAVKFRDYGIAKGKTYADHDAAFRNWLKSPYSSPKADLFRQNGPQLGRGGQVARKFKTFQELYGESGSKSEKILETTGEAGESETEK